MGVFVNAPHLMELIGQEKLAKRYGSDYENLLRPVPDTPEELTFSRELTAKAVEVAVQRHAGSITNLYGPSGQTTLAQGKDLTRVKFIIGTGGALTRLPGGDDILRSIRAETGKLLLPRLGAGVLLDHDYILASLGVLCNKHRTGALYLMRESLGIER